MKRKNPTQRGQALILIALAIVGLVGFTALAIDGSIIFSNHRHSQNASDTAAYAGALSYVRDAAGNWKQSALDRAADNGFAAANGAEVDVYLCSDLPQTVSGRVLDCQGLPTGAVKSDYVYVHIKSKVDLFFARVLGWQQYVDHTDAVVLAETQKETSWFPGYALVSTMLGCPNYNHDPFKVQGSSVTTILNAGILVNSDCQNPDPAYDQDSNASSVTTATGVCVVGDADYSNTSPAPTDCEPIDVNKFTLPRPLCENYPDGEISGSNGNYYATPGRYGRDFNFDSIVDKNPNGTLKLLKGIYCFYDGLEINSQWYITTDLDPADGPDDYDSATEGVFFYIPSGDLKFNAGSDIHIHAVGTTEDDFPKDYVNYLFYVPPSNHNEIIITGANESRFTGTILAPNSYIRLNGGSGTVGLNSQIIGYAIALEGNGTLDIDYKAADNAVTTYNPSLSGIE